MCRSPQSSPSLCPTRPRRSVPGVNSPRLARLPCAAAPNGAQAALCPAHAAEALAQLSERHRASLKALGARRQGRARPVSSPLGANATSPARFGAALWYPFAVPRP
jgi:hypothetical protein